MPTLRLRKLADHDAEPDQHGRLPLAGIRVDGDLPAEHQFSTGFVERGRVEGWIELENMRAEVLQVEQPDDSLWAQAVLLADAIVLKTVDGDVTYKVTRQPGVHAGEVFLGYDTELAQED